MSVTMRPSQAALGRILVVEDQDSVREFMHAMLAKAGYDVAVAANGMEAVAAVRDLPFDLVLMDVHMPVMDGLAATRQIRALGGRRSKVPVIAISGSVPGLVAAGVNDHLGKPFRKVDLLRKIDRWLNGAGGSGESQSACSPPAGRGPLEEACELMGRPWAVRGLKRLVTQIDETFGAPQGMTRDDGQLARQAHGLVSLAALLGFASLSELCSTLEDACMRHLGLELPFEQARAAASSARTVALGLIAELDGANA